MKDLRKLTPEEVQALMMRGCSAESWDEISVCDPFSVDQLMGVSFAGVVEIGEGVVIRRSYIANYSIGAGSVIEDVTRLETRSQSSFGNGVEVATINENGGRAVLIYDELTAQIAYMWALYRHRTTMCDRLKRFVQSYAQQRSSQMGHIGRGCRIVGAKFIREVDIRDDVTIEGASLVECATLMTGAKVGVDVRGREFIAAEGARIDTGATIERCFVGECAIVASMFSAVDSLIFASSHLENGEAASIFAAPYTVSHHKSSLLIAGLFSFFNAGSGSNQSNHLFKCGAVHQAIHPRGCKFASGTYVMAPAIEGAFTMVKGSHAHHHDTSSFPFSYLIEDNGRSLLMPGANLTSYGTQRDMEKWPQRDKRCRRRDIINYEEHNPYLTSAMVRAVNTIHTLTETNPDADEYMWERVVIRRSLMRRGLGLYNKAIAASLGDMLSRGEMIDVAAAGEWVDMAGAYLPQSVAIEIIEDIETGKITSLREISEAYENVAAHYDSYAHTYARHLLTQLLGSDATEEQIASTVESAKGSYAELQRQRENDMNRDCSLSMAVGYGVDFYDTTTREADFKVVRDL